MYSCLHSLKKARPSGTAAPVTSIKKLRVIRYNPPSPFGRTLLQFQKIFSPLQVHCFRIVTATHTRQLQVTAQWGSQSYSKAASMARQAICSRHQKHLSAQSVGSVFPCQALPAHMPAAGSRCRVAHRDHCWQLHLHCPWSGDLLPKYHHMFTSGSCAARLQQAPEICC